MCVLSVSILCNSENSSLNKNTALFQIGNKYSTSLPENVSQS